MKKVLIITYYWPPAGGPGVQRILKYAQYLPDFGWQPIILAPKRGEYPGLDPLLEKKIPKNCIVYKTNIIEPGALYKKFVGFKKDQHIPVAVLTEKNLSWKKKLANWVRLNLFIPDAKIGWRFSALRMADKIIKKHNPDIIFSSSPPPSVHLIARKIAAKYNKKWVADFRDPWTKIHYYNQLPKFKLSQYIDNFLEKKTLQKATKVTTVNRDFFDTIYENKEIIISNGYDSNDFPKLEPFKNKKFNICYTGSLKTRQFVQSLFSSLRDLCLEENTLNLLQINFFGNVDPDVKQKIIDMNINCQIEFKGFMAHEIILSEIMKADLLLIIIGKSERASHIFSTKVFEYLYARKPIIAVGQKGSSVDKLIQKTNSGKLFDYEDSIGIKKYIIEIIDTWKNNEPFISFNNTEIEKYERKALTKKLVDIFEEII